jgi:phosphate starvation-inducible PhoH-like protein
MSAEPTLDGIIRHDVAQPPSVMIRTRKKTIVPRSATQTRYMEELARRDVIFALGPAGTGKTYVAVAQAVSQLITGSVDRLILSRPAVEAGERLGFLPGDMKEKVDPYLRPLYDALYDMIPAEQVERRIASGEIEIAPLAFMRGRTLANAFIILDEAQNTTKAQMKMFLTRFGEGSRMVICGDPNQVDLLPMAGGSGLADAVERLEGVEGISVIRFSAADVVRHPIVGRIVQAYEGPVTDDAEVRSLNAQYRHKDTPTNVLSFPMVQPDLLETLANSDDGEALLGDIVLARETCAREAEEKGIAFADHAAHLIAHGTLHLLGYDHMEEHEAEEMEAMEVRALASIGITDPYFTMTGD